MKRKLSDWASIAEIVSGIAVMVTLIVLIVGVRENTSVTRSSMYATSIAEISAMERTIVADEDLSIIYGAWARGEPDGLTDADLQRLIIIVANRFRAYDSAYLMSSNDLIFDEQWERTFVLVCDSYQRALDFNIGFIVELGTSASFYELIQATCVE